MTDWDDAVRRYLSAHPKRSFKVRELQRALRIPGSQTGKFRALVLDMSREGRIALLPRRRIQALSHAQLLEGVVEGVGEFATHVCLSSGDRLPLAEGEADDVAPGDRVRVRRLQVSGERMVAVQRVVRAAPRAVFGQLQRIGDRWVLIPDRRIPGLSGGVFVDGAVTLASDSDGMLARAALPAFDPATTRPLAGEVVVLGPADHPRAAMARLIGRSGWPLEFTAAAREQALCTHDPVTARRDWVDRLIFTIDPLDAKDHDDAVCVEPMPGGGYRLAVHIADVASFVPREGALDEEARARATSVYPPGGVLPMLPEELSAGACSLHHGVRRRTLAVELQYDAQGRRTWCAMGPAWIRSRASLAYEHAEALLTDGTPPPGDRIDDLGVQPLREALTQMLALATELRARRRELGSLFVERPERVFSFDSLGHVSKVGWRASLRTHWIIEEFMLEANRAVAEALHNAELPLLWRVHEEPDAVKVNDLVELLRMLGVRWKPHEPITGQDYGRLFDQVRDTPQTRLVSLLALRSLMKARYRAGWDRHFGLGFHEYTHFTSPIRRYPDLQNQRWLHRLVERAGTAGWLDDALQAGRRMAGERLSHPSDHDDARRLADHCSDQERRAMELERSAADICAADALRDREGQALDGMVVSVVGSGLFVELEEAGLDGFVAVEQLPNDWYTFDARRQILVGQRTGRIWRMGQRVRVLLERVDVAGGRVWLSGLEPANRG